MGEVLVKRPLHAARCRLSYGCDQSRQRVKRLGGRVCRETGEASRRRRRRCPPARGVVWGATGSSHLQWLTRSSGGSLETLNLWLGCYELVWRLKVRLVTLGSILLTTERANQIVACPITVAAHWRPSTCADANW